MTTKAKSHVKPSSISNFYQYFAFTNLAVSFRKFATQDLALVPIAINFTKTYPKVSVRKISNWTRTSSPSLDLTHLKSLNAKATTWKAKNFFHSNNWMNWLFDEWDDTQSHKFFECVAEMLKKYFPSLGCCSKHKETPTRKNVNFKYYH